MGGNGGQDAGAGPDASRPRDVGGPTDARSQRAGGMGTATPTQQVGTPRGKLGTVNTQLAKGSVCVGAATQAEQKSYAVNDAQPQLGGKFTAALIQKGQASSSAPLEDVVKTLTVADTFERQYTTGANETLTAVAAKHLVDVDSVRENAKNRQLKRKRPTDKLPANTRVWIANYVAYPTSAFMAGKRTIQSEGNKKYALICSNWYYRTAKYESDVESAQHDAQMMDKLLKGRGFTTKLEPNKTAAQLVTLVGHLPDTGIGTAPKAGDEIVFYYSGHGEPTGLRCAQDGPSGIVEVKVFEEIATKAHKKKLRLTVLLDSCHSGAIADAIRRLGIGLLNKEVTDAKKKAILGHVDALQKLKDKLSALENTYAAHMVKGQHLYTDVEEAKKSGNQAKVQQCEASFNKWSGSLTTDLAPIVKKIKDAWFGSLAAIKQALDGIKSNGGPNTADVARYKYIIEMLKYTGNRSGFDQHWNVNNNHNDFRPQELDDIDDVMNAAMEHART